MRLPARSFLSFSLFVLLASPLVAQTPAGAPASVSEGGSSQSAALLARAAAALGGTTALSDITLSGTVRRIAGSDDESGQAVLKARASGQSRLELHLPSGKHSESRDVSPNVGPNVGPGFSLASSGSPVPTGKWSGPDGTSHDIAYHNLLAEPVWLSPALAVSQALAKPNTVVTNLGEETRNGATVLHLTVNTSGVGVGAPPSGSEGGSSSAAPALSDTDRLLQHLSQFDLFLDSATLLPVALTFNIHPDNNALLDIPVEVRYSDYRSVNGVKVPFHLEKFLNGSLSLDVQLESAAINSGLTAADFSL